jgi:hypothetical protein
VTNARKVALAVFVAVLFNWAWLAWRLWSGLHPDSDEYLRDTYFLVADTRYVAINLAISLVPAALAALLASPARWAQPMLRAGVQYLLVCSLLILFSACIDLVAHLILKGAYMPRRYDNDPLILALTGSIWLRLIGGALGVIGMLVSAVGLVRARTDPTP